MRVDQAELHCPALARDPVSAVQVGVGLEVGLRDPGLGLGQGG